MINTSTLISDIEADLGSSSPSKTMSDHAEALGEAYDQFCSALTTSYGGSLEVRGKSSFISTFLSTVNIPIPTLDNYGLAIQLGAVAYWASSSFSLLSGLPPGFASQSLIVQTPPVGINLGMVALATPGGNASTVASIIGNALSTGTISGVQTTHTGLTPPAPIPVPIVAGPSPLI